MVGWECPTKPRGASGLDPEAVHYLDPELLEAVLFESTPAEVGYDPDKTMIFDYQRLRVAVRNNGWVFVYEPTDRSD
jgi:hypothetical protein